MLIPSGKRWHKNVPQAGPGQQAASQDRLRKVYLHMELLSVPAYSKHSKVTKQPQGLALRKNRAKVSEQEPSDRRSPLSCHVASVLQLPPWTHLGHGSTRTGAELNQSPGRLVPAGSPWPGLLVRSGPGTLVVGEQMSPSLPSCEEELSIVWLKHCEKLMLFRFVKLLSEGHRQVPISMNPIHTKNSQIIFS